MSDGPVTEDGKGAANFVDDLIAEVKRRGVPVVAKAADMKPKRLREIIADPIEMRISVFSRLCRAVDMPHGEFHLVDQRTDKCMTCDQPRAAHYPLLNEAAL